MSPLRTLHRIKSSPGSSLPGFFLCCTNWTLPTGNLDKKNSKEIIDMLKLSNRNLNQTIVLITHDENVALAADRIVTIEDGKIIGDRKRG